RLHTTRTRPDSRPRRAVRLLPGAPRAAPDAALLDRTGGVPAHTVGQGAKVRAARPLPRPSTRRRDKGRRPPYPRPAPPRSVIPSAAAVTQSIPEAGLLLP